MFPARDDSLKFGQPVFNPFNRRGRVQFGRRNAQFFGRLNRDNPMSPGREIGRIASGPRADVKDNARRAGHQVQHRSMGVLEPETLVADKQIGCLIGVTLRSLYFWGHSDLNRYRAAHDRAVQHADMGFHIVIGERPVQQGAVVPN